MTRPPFRRVLVANRGEIAVRIMRACHELGMEAVAVYSDADARAGYVRLADEAIRIGPAPATESYLRGGAIIDAALGCGADAIHPGYGFLAERADFARAVGAAGLTFVGPPPPVIEQLGNKLAARRLATAVDVPVVPGLLEPIALDRPDQLDAIAEIVDRIGYPLLVKAAAGGGGRGMRRVARRVELPAALLAASREAAMTFGDGSVYVEREVEPARHVEVQLLGDAGGLVVALGERDCSIQRRHQKLIEEAPAPGLRPAERRQLHELAVRLGRAAGLQNAATVEFLRDAKGAPWFLEVNTRLQVEHGVTELVSGVDLVVEQFRLAAGLPLSGNVRAAADRAAEPDGHAIEVRLSAEDPARDFVPTPGRIRRWIMPAGPGIRVDAAVSAGDRVPPDYDPLIAKILVYASDRVAAVNRLRRALDETEVGGIQTTLPFHRFVARSRRFQARELATTWVGRNWAGRVQRAGAVRDALLAAGLASLGEGGGDRQLAETRRADTGPVRHDRRAGTLARDGSTPNTWRAAGRAAGIDRWPS